MLFPLEFVDEKMGKMFMTLQRQVPSDVLGTSHYWNTNSFKGRVMNSSIENKSLLKGEQNNYSFLNFLSLIYFFGL